MVKLVRQKPCIGQILQTLRRKIIVLTSIDREKPCKGDTLSKPRAQALGQSLKHIYVSPFRGGTILSKANARSVSAAPAELILLLSVCTQGSISGFALITPWAMKKYRA